MDIQTEARQVKKTVSVTTGQRKKWDKESFFKDAKDKLTQIEVAAIYNIYDKCQLLKAELAWGTGKTNGSFSVKWPQLGRYSVFTIFSDGTLTINFGSFNKGEEELAFIDFLKNELVNRLCFSFPEDYRRRYSNFKVSTWGKKVDDFSELLEFIQEKYPETNV